MDNFTLGPTLDFTAVDLYQSATCLYSGAGSYVLSPLSILYAGALLYLGSNGPTRDNLNTALHFRRAFGNKSDILEGVFDNTAKMLSLEEVLDPSNKLPHIPNKAPTEVALLNGVFHDPSIKLWGSFVKKVTKTLHAGVYEQSLLRNSDEAIKSMNDWVTTNTFGQITKLVAPKSLSPTSTVALVNTLYFRAAWDSHFPTSDPNLDRDSFYHLDGNVSQPLYMWARRTIPYAEDDDLDVQYVELPYVGDFYMLIILPRQRDGIRNCEHQFNSQALRNMRSKVPMLKAANQRLVNLKLPKFKIEGTFDMAKLFAKVGVTHALGPKADFSRMVASGKPDFAVMNHKVVFEIDEWGTEAAAVSALQGPAPMGLMQSDASWVPDYAPVDFTADHPFLFAVLHRPTESLLFIGRMESPNS
ncbi:leukocyte elastase inhibitor-like [Paramacrobiotus metropolitanus]|uniref:leukocyte elastase inhibitor-like n=1 Tax=Paramacrobiotus metropolitanus TaxID=2943436 RepID=UPI002446002B|nr:leukocyte elastase inhibitor-like [Paramacrobiotus metropolitanus]